MLVGMTRDDVTAEQAEKIYEQLWPATNYLVRLLRRMRDLDFSRDDSLLADVEVAYSAMNRLGGQLHYLSVATGMGPSRLTDADVSADHPRLVE